MSDSSSSPPAPDYGPAAAASDHAADLGYSLGQQQLTQAQSQYDQNMAVAQPVVTAQLGLMNQQQQQGDDYYNYMKANQRPVENALNQESMQDNTGRDAAERGLINGGNTGIYNARQGDIEQGVDRATADARQGTTAQMNQLIRQGQRYGYSPQAMAARFAPQAIQQGLGVASAANTARNQGIDQARGLLTQNRSMRMQDDATNWAKKLDVAGLYRNLPGASQGAYGLATNAGNAAVANQAQPGAQYMSGLAQGAATQQTGAGQQLQGLTGILNSQGSTYGAGLQAAGQSASGTGSMIGGIAGAAITVF